MAEESDRRRVLRALPSVDELLRSAELSAAVKAHPAGLVTDAVRFAVESVRAGILEGEVSGVTTEEISSLALARMEELLKPSLTRVVNATGTVLHTNLGRAPMSPDAAEAARLAALNYVNLEMDVTTGERGERDSLVTGLINRLTGAEASCVVNNNAAAVLVTLNTLASGREVVVSRGELIEIGGSFRLPEVMEKSGCLMKEVGTTNRTHPSDYTGALSEDTALLFKAHRSNYTVAGFTSEVDLRELVEIGSEAGLPVVEDLGAGSLVDLSAYGLPREPVVRERIALGADCVTFSGDKLLGGPQAGIIAGKRELVERIRKNPLKRALRADKMTLASLEATLRLYLDPERLPERLPVLRTMTRDVRSIARAASRAAAMLRDALGEGFSVEVAEDVSVVGGGSLPGHTLPTRVVAVTHPELSAGKIYRLFISSDPPVVGRLKNDRFLLDMRTVTRAADVVPGLRGRKRSK